MDIITADVPSLKEKLEKIAKEEGWVT